MKLFSSHEEESLERKQTSLNEAKKDASLRKKKKKELNVRERVCALPLRSLDERRGTYH